MCGRDQWFIVIPRMFDQQLGSLPIMCSRISQQLLKVAGKGQTFKKLFPDTQLQTFNWLTVPHKIVVCSCVCCCFCLLGWCND